MLQPFRFELKSLAETGEIEGFASTYDVDRGGDQVMRGAFAKSVAAQPDGIPMLWSHHVDEPIGRWTELTENASGLHVKGKLLLALAKARETYELLRAQVVTGLSIGYKTVRADWDQNIGARLLKEIDLFEISICVFGMNPNARIIAVKTDEITTERDYERLLRDVGFARARAKLLSKGFVSADDALRDAERTKVSDLARFISERASSLSNRRPRNGH